MKKLISISLALSLLLGSTAVSLPASAEEENLLTLTTEQNEYIIGIDESYHTAYFYAQGNFQPEEITLVNADTGETAGIMKDNGNFTEYRDSLAGDGTYSCCFTVDLAEPTVFSFYAVADGVRSNTVQIRVAEMWTQESLDEMSAVDNQIRFLLNDADYQALDTDARKEAVSALLQDLAENGTEQYPYSLIQPDSIAFDEETQEFFFLYNCGEWSNSFWSDNYILFWADDLIEHDKQKEAYQFENFTRFVLDLPQRENTISCGATNGGDIAFFDETHFDVIDTVADIYHITLEPGCNLDEDIYSTLSELIHDASGNPADIKTSLNDPFSCSNLCYLTKDQGTKSTWTLSIGSYYQFDEEAVLQALHRLTGFQHIDYALGGYFVSDTLNHYSSSWLTVTCARDDMTEADFAPYLELSSLEQSETNPNRYVISCAGIQQNNWYKAACTLLENDVIQSVDSFNAIMTSLATNEFSVLRDDPIRYLQNGDVNNDSKIDADDAYEALTSYASCSVGKEDTLQPVQRVAADYDLNGQVDANDAYEMLLTYASNSVGKETD